MPVESSDIPVMRIHLLITQYPILGVLIRERMRQELFRRGVITPARLENEAREKAILSQHREGLFDPLVEEKAEIWERRLGQIRDYLTDFYFAYNLPQHLFDEIVERVLLERGSHEDGLLTYNPELAPWDVLFRQAEEYAALPPEELDRVKHHLQEIKVVLIKAMISDQLAFVRVAKEYLNVDDLQWIRSHRIGQGKIGGKAAGFVLATRILQQTFAAQPKAQVVVPRSYFIGADAFYEFLSLNNISYYINQKYKTMEQIADEYPGLQQTYCSSPLPDSVVEGLRRLLGEVGREPLIVRSSSLLEDNFGSAFAGKYETVFCPNQGTPDENLAALSRAITLLYASVANPNALLYRKQKGLLDFDERMAVLIQTVQGERYHEFFFPAVAGMAYSRNPFLWNPKLRRADGFARLVVGLGTRAVEHVSEDYPRMVALSHPQLRPESGAEQIRYYSQYYMDLLNLSTNRLETSRIKQVLAGDFPSLRYLASLDKGDYVEPMYMKDPSLDPSQLVMTFEGLLTRTTFVEKMKTMLKALEHAYGNPVDVEFTVSLGDSSANPAVQLHLLQCRPHISPNQEEEVVFPAGIPEQDIIFGTEKLVPTGRVREIRYVVYVDPERYLSVLAPSEKLQLARLIGQINQRLEGHRFILMGPGRWGSSNPDLGLKVGYAEIYNTAALVEIGQPRGGARPTLSYGTHFFQDLVESHIYPLAIFPGEPGNPFRRQFLLEAPNALPALLPDGAQFGESVKVIDVPATTGGRTLELVMSGELGKALAFLTQPGS